MKKFNLRNSVAIAVYTMLVAVCVGCAKQDCKYKLSVTSVNGRGWDKSYTTTKCDSVNMISTTKAEVWIDGNKNIIETNNHIRVYSNCN